MASLKPVVRWTANYAAASSPQNHTTCSTTFIPRNRRLFAPIRSLKSSNSSLFHCLDSSPTSQLYDGRSTTDHHMIHPPMEEEEEEEEEDINSQKLDQWVRDSAVEIVKNIDEAPFLVHIYSGSTRIKTVKEKAVADKWPMIEGRWKEGSSSSSSPNGVILVEQLNSSSSNQLDVDHNEELCSSSSSTKLWGILIQGKRKTCTACYLLKTSQVRGVAGSCTHFCLLRVDCFTESADILLKNSWLQMP